MRIYDYIQNIENPVSDDEYVIVESLELRAVMSALDKTMKELDKKKKMSADIAIEFMDLQKRIEKLLRKPVQSSGMKEGVDLNEKILGFGKSGSAQIVGRSIVITKNGKSVEITKDELKEILAKVK
jgi:arsenate reductase-like glutaredoxin family protein